MEYNRLFITIICFVSIFCSCNTRLNESDTAKENDNKETKRAKKTSFPNSNKYIYGWWKVDSIKIGGKSTLPRLEAFGFNNDNSADHMIGTQTYIQEILIGPYSYYNDTLSFDSEYMPQYWKLDTVFTNTIIMTELFSEKNKNSVYYLSKTTYQKLTSSNNK